MKTLNIIETSTPAEARLARMKKFDMFPVIKFLEREGISNSKAKELCDALLQWLAGHAALEHQTAYVMLHGDIDKAFHAFVLHTKLYASFCKEYVGFFIHHTPLDSQQANSEEVLAGVAYTTNFLDSEFKQLHPLLREWVELARAGLVTVSAVSCVKNGYPDET